MSRVFRFPLGRWVCLSPWCSPVPWGQQWRGSPQRHQWPWLWLGLRWWSWLVWWQWWRCWSGWQWYRPYLSLAQIHPQWRRFCLRSQGWCFTFQGVCIPRSWGWHWHRSVVWCWILLPYQWSSLWVAHWWSLAWLPQLWSLAWITRLRHLARFTQLGCLLAFLHLLGLLWLGVFLGFWGLRQLCLLGFLPGWRPHGFTLSPIRSWCWALPWSCP